MKFKTVLIKDCLGLIIAGTILVNNEGKKFKISKGTKINIKIKKILIKNGYDKINGFFLENNDIEENKAAKLIAKNFCKKKKNNLNYNNLNTGRSNIHATKPGLFIYNSNDLIDLNSNSKIAISAIRPFSKVVKNQELITVKVIPYSIENELLTITNKKVNDAFKVVPFQKKSVSLIQTYQIKKNEKVLKKAKFVTEKRIASCGINSLNEIITVHEKEKLCDKIKLCIKNEDDLILIIGPHAITHTKDIIPNAISMSGAKIIRFGIPVEPGNLLLLSEFKSINKKIYIIGMPSCAKSPKENGFDWILWRILSDVNFNNLNINELSVGGFIK